MAVNSQYTLHFGYSPVQVVVHHHVRRELSAGALLPDPELETAGNLVLVVTTSAQPGGLHLWARRQQQHDDGVRVATLHLRGSLQIDLEQYVASRRWIRIWRAVQVAEELGPLEEPVVRDAGFEGVPIDEGIRVSRLTRATGARRPRSTEPQRRISFDKTGRERPFPGSAGA